MSDVDLKQFAKAAFSSEELEFLLKDPPFRLIYDSMDNRAETFETLCFRGQEVLIAAGFRSNRR